MSWILPSITFSIAIWLGFYLLARDNRNPRLFWTGFGLLVYGLVLASQSLRPYVTDMVQLEVINQLIFVFPSLFWAGTLVHLLPEDAPIYSRSMHLWGYARWYILCIPVLIAGCLLFLDLAAQPMLMYLLLLVSFLPFLCAFIGLAYALYCTKPDQLRSLSLAATLFFGLGSMGLLLPYEWVDQQWFILAIGLDFLILGSVIATIDAFDLGEALFPDLMRSFDVSLLSALLFGGLVGLTMSLSTGVNLGMLLLLFATLFAAIAIQVFNSQIQAVMDQVAFAASPQLQQERSELRAAVEASPKVNPAFQIEAMDEAEFAKLTRRALSNFGNLPRLASSPLTHLVIVDARLAQRNGSDNTLERANELKRLLGEAVEQLRPEGEGDFGETKAWRHYNALYYPYVAGIKPYNRSAIYEELAPAIQQALEWFRTQVPERTLYNWQAAGAKLVAQYLRELEMREAVRISKKSS